MVSLTENFDRNLLVLENEHASTTSKVAAINDICRSNILEWTRSYAMQNGDNLTRFLRAFLKFIENFPEHCSNDVLEFLEHILRHILLGPHNFPFSSHLFNIVSKVLQSATVFETAVQTGLQHVTTRERYELSDPEMTTKLLKVLELINVCDREGLSPGLDHIPTVTRYLDALLKCLNVIGLCSQETLTRLKNEALFISQKFFSTFSDPNIVPSIRGSLNHWVETLFSLIFGDDSHVKQLAFSALQSLWTYVSAVGHANDELCSSELTRDVISSYCPRLVKLVEEANNESPKWTEIWCLMVEILGHRLTNIQPSGGHLVNSFLSVEEKAFKLGNSFKEDAFRCWKHLIKVFCVLHPEDIKKRSKLFLQPLLPNNAKTEQLVQLKFDVFWYLVCHTTILQNDHPIIVIPFLKYSFAITSQTDLNQLSAAPSNNSNQGFSVIRRRSGSVRTACLDTFAQVLSPVATTTFGDSVFEMPRCDVVIIRSPAMFLEMYQLIIYCACDAILTVASKSTQQHNKYLNFIWESLAYHLRIIVTSTEFSIMKVTEVVRHLLKFLYSMCRHCSNPTFASLLVSPVFENIVCGKNALPARCMTQKLPNAKMIDDSLATPAAFLVESLLVPAVVASDNQVNKYLKVIEVLLECGFTSDCALNFAISVMKRLESTSYKCEGKALTVCSVWVAITKKLTTVLRTLLIENTELTNKLVEMVLCFPIIRAEFCRTADPAFTVTNRELHVVWKNFLNNVVESTNKEDRRKNRFSGILCSKILAYLKKSLERQQLLYISLFIRDIASSLTSEEINKSITESTEKLSDGKDLIEDPWEQLSGIPEALHNVLTQLEKYVNDKDETYYCVVVCTAKCLCNLVSGMRYHIFTLICKLKSIIMFLIDQVNADTKLPDFEETIIDMWIKITWAVKKNWSNIDSESPLLILISILEQISNSRSTNLISSTVKYWPLVLSKSDKVYSKLKEQMICICKAMQEKLDIETQKNKNTILSGENMARENLDKGLCDNISEKVNNLVEIPNIVVETTSSEVVVPTITVKMKTLVESTEVDKAKCLKEQEIAKEVVTVCTVSGSQGSSCVTADKNLNKSKRSVKILVDTNNIVEEKETCSEESLDVSKIDINAATMKAKETEDILGNSDINDLNSSSNNVVSNSGILDNVNKHIIGSKSEQDSSSKVIVPQQEKSLDDSECTSKLQLKNLKENSNRLLDKGNLNSIDQLSSDSTKFKLVKINKTVREMEESIKNGCEGIQNGPKCQEGMKNNFRYTFRNVNKNLSCTSESDSSKGLELQTTQNNVLCSNSYTTTTNCSLVPKRNFQTENCELNIEKDNTKRRSLRHKSELNSNSSKLKDDISSGDVLVLQIDASNSLVAEPCPNLSFKEGKDNLDENKTLNEPDNSGSDNMQSVSCASGLQREIGAANRFQGNTETKKSRNEKKKAEEIQVTQSEPSTSEVVQGTNIQEPAEMGTESSKFLKPSVRKLRQRAKDPESPLQQSLRKPLTKTQRMSLKRKSDDIPALYNDLSQDTTQNSFSDSSQDDSQITIPERVSFPNKLDIEDKIQSFTCLKRRRKPNSLASLIQDTISPSVDKDSAAVNTPNSMSGSFSSESHPEVKLNLKTSLQESRRSGEMDLSTLNLITPARKSVDPVILDENAIDATGNILKVMKSDAKTDHSVNEISLSFSQTSNEVKDKSDDKNETVSQHSISLLEDTCRRRKALRPVKKVIHKPFKKIKKRMPKMNLKEKNVSASNADSNSDNNFQHKLDDSVDRTVSVILSDILTEHSGKFEPKNVNQCENKNDNGNQCSGPSLFGASPYVQEEKSLKTSRNVSEILEKKKNGMCVPDVKAQSIISSVGKNSNEADVLESKLSGVPQERTNKMEKDYSDETKNVTNTRKRKSRLSLQAEMISPPRRRSRRALSGIVNLDAEAHLNTGSSKSVDNTASENKCSLKASEGTLLCDSGIVSDKVDLKDNSIASESLVSQSRKETNSGVKRFKYENPKMKNGIDMNDSVEMLHLDKKVMSPDVDCIDIKHINASGKDTENFEPSNSKLIDKEFTSIVNDNFHSPELKVEEILPHTEVVPPGCVPETKLDNLENIKSLSFSDVSSGIIPCSSKSVNKINEETSNLLAGCTESSSLVEQTQTKIEKLEKKAVSTDKEMNLNENCDRPQMFTKEYSDDQKAEYSILVSHDNSSTKQSVVETVSTDNCATSSSIVNKYPVDDKFIQSPQSQTRVCNKPYLKKLNKGGRLLRSVKPGKKCHFCSDCKVHQIPPTCSPQSDTLLSKSNSLDEKSYLSCKMFKENKVFERKLENIVSCNEDLSHSIAVSSDSLKVSNIAEINAVVNMTQHKVDGPHSKLNPESQDFVESSQDGLPQRNMIKNNEFLAGSDDSSYLQINDCHSLIETTECSSLKMVVEDRKNCNEKNDETESNMSLEMEKNDKRRYGNSGSADNMKQDDGEATEKTGTTLKMCTQESSLELRQHSSVPPQVRWSIYNVCNPLNRPVVEHSTPSNNHNFDVVHKVTPCTTSISESMLSAFPATSTNKSIQPLDDTELHEHEHENDNSGPPYVSEIEITDRIPVKVENEEAHSDAAVSLCVKPDSCHVQVRKRPEQSTSCINKIRVGVTRKVKQMTARSTRKGRMKDLQQSGEEEAPVPDVNEKQKTPTSTHLSQKKAKSLNCTAAHCETNMVCYTDPDGQKQMKEWVKFQYKPEASPGVPILKRHCEETAQGMSPNKRKRVSFYDPEISQRLLFSYSPEDYELKHDENLFLDEDEAAATDDSTDVCYPVMNLTDIEEECSQYEMEDDAGLLDSQSPIWPSLSNCTYPIDSIIALLVSPTWSDNALKYFKEEKGIKTIGDLSSLDEARVNRLHIKQPRVQIVKKVLKAYEQKLNKIITRGETAAEVNLSHNDENISKHNSEAQQKTSVSPVINKQTLKDTSGDRSNNFEKMEICVQSENSTETNSIVCQLVKQSGVEDTCNIVEENCNSMVECPNWDEECSSPDVVIVASKLPVSNLEQSTVSDSSTIPLHTRVTEHKTVSREKVGQTGKHTTVDDNILKSESSDNLETNSIILKEKDCKIKYLQDKVLKVGIDDVANVSTEILSCYSKDKMINSSVDAIINIHKHQTGSNELLVTDTVASCSTLNVSTSRGSGECTSMKLEEAGNAPIVTSETSYQNKLAYDQLDVETAECYRKKQLSLNVEQEVIADTSKHHVIVSEIDLASDTTTEIIVDGFTTVKNDKINVSEKHKLSSDNFGVAAEELPPALKDKVDHFLQSLNLQSLVKKADASSQEEEKMASSLGSYMLKNILALLSPSAKLPFALSAFNSLQNLVREPGFKTALYPSNVSKVELSSEEDNIETSRKTRKEFRSVGVEVKECLCDAEAVTMLNSLTSYWSTKRGLPAATEPFSLGTKK